MEQLIYVEQRDKEEASKLSKDFTINETKNRAYINTLGSELAMKYLAQENISVSNIHNIHNIHKIREEFDIADIMLPNIHIDVRVVYDEDLIFIPRKHFDYDITPDIYLVLNLSEDLTYAKFLGFFEPKLINKNNQNKNYYFIEKEKLSNPSDLKTYIENFKGNTTMELSESELEEGQRLAISFVDNDITDNDKQTLLQMLLKSATLRENLAEFDNFEVISYHTVATEDIDVTQPPVPVIVDEFEKFESNDEFEEFDSDEEQISTNENITKETIDEVIDSPVDELTPENTIQPELEESIDLEYFDNFNENDLVEEEPTNTEEILNALPEEPLQEDNLNSDNLDEIDSLITFDEKLSDEDTIKQNNPQEEASVEEGDYNIIDADEGNTISFESLSTTDSYYNSTETTEQSTDTISFEEFESQIEEPVTITPPPETSMSLENSTIITNQDIVPGEIVIDINQTEAKEPQDDLGFLYNNEDKYLGEEQLQTNKPEYGKKAIFMGIVFAAILATGGIFALTTLNKVNNNIAQNPITPPTNPTEEISKEKPIEEQPIPEIEKSPINKLDQNKQEQNIKPQKPAQIQSNSPYLEVRKLNWAVPSYLSYNDEFRKYLQTAGKSLKLSISSDLLLATEYNYSDEINVDITLSKEGSITDAKILKTSGSDQIDGIVLQTVKETLNMVKVPSGLIDKDKTHMTLKIYL